MKKLNTSHFAFGAASLFIIGIVCSIILSPPEKFEGIPPFSLVITSLAFLLFHLAMLPLITNMNAPAWAKGSGFVWVAFDNVLEILALFGEGHDLITPMRWGIHLATATWIIGVSISYRGFLHWFGIVTALTLAGITLYGPFLANREMVAQTLGPGAILFIVWIIMIGVFERKKERIDETKV